MVFAGPEKGHYKDGDAGAGVFPEREEILLRNAALGGVALKRIGASNPNKPAQHLGPLVRP